MKLLQQVVSKNNYNKKDVSACENFLEINKDILNKLDKLDNRRKNTQTRNLIKAYLSYNDCLNKLCKTNKIKKAMIVNKDEILRDAFNNYIDEYLDNFQYGYKSLNKAVEEEIKDHVSYKLSEYVPSYHSHQEGKLHFLKTVGEEEKRYFGLELESKGDIENACLIEQFKNLFSPEEDGSLTEQGFELVSEPMTLKYLYKNKSKIDSMLKILIKNGQYIDEDCGFHVHVSRNAFTKGSLLRLVKIVSEFKQDFETFARRKESEDYARYVEYEPKFLWFKGDSFADTYDISRYQAINFQNKKTVEFRMFAGTLDTTEIYATIELVNNLINITNDKTIKSFEFKDLLIGKNIKKYLNNNNFLFSSKVIRLDEDNETSLEEISDLEREYENINISINTRAKKMIISKTDSFDFVEIDKYKMVKYKNDTVASQTILSPSFNQYSLRSIVEKLA